MNYKVEPSQLAFDPSTSSLTLPFLSSTYPGQPALNGQLTIHNNGIVRLTAVETNGKYPRVVIQDVVQDDAVKPFTGQVQFTKLDNHAELSWTMEGRGESYSSLAASAALPTKRHTNKLVLHYSPFHMVFSVDDTEVMSVNSGNLMHFEQYRDRNQQTREAPVAPHPPTNTEGWTEEQIASANDFYQNQLKQYETEKAEYDAAVSASIWPVDTKGAWEETHGSHTDHKSRGPAAVGLDITFTNSKHVYGIPEHASSFALKNTNGNGAEYREPYRLYNLDVFEYELNEPMALYGAVPYVVSHTVDGKYTSGMLWLNAAETYVDISDIGTSSLFGSSTPQKRVHWMSETGRMDAFFILGPKPSDVFLQYTELTGFPFLPPQYSIGYHQCRWNYKSSDDVLSVDGQFDKHDIPYDVIWLDIEHTDAKKYFTWDKSSFPDPAAMQEALGAKGRHLVTIVDPHIKRDNNYHVHQEATRLGHYVKKKDGSDYDGWCWPGSSSYLDFFQSTVRQFWADNFGFNLYHGATRHLSIWNDMNEPSVFNGPEVSMPKDNLHKLDNVPDRVEHREVHNQYGMYVHMGTAAGLIARDQNKQRPFVLSRSFFAGSQRTVAIWTGDNAAKWDHLKIAGPMLLSMAVAQIPFSGSDVGGFFGDPDAQLLTRWYQAGAFHPFFRGHAHIDAKRREPYLFGEPYTSIIRQAIRTRYSYMPYLYTQFYLNSITGMPIMRPLWVEFPSDPKTFGLENQFLVGSSLLVHPVVDPDVTTSIVYLPAGVEGVEEVWYDLQNDSRHPGGQTLNVLTPLQHIPVFQRGGSIIAKRERARRNSALMAHDPYTLVIALSAQMTASGKLFMDDMNSFDYQQPNGSIVQLFEFRDGQLTGRFEKPTTFKDQNTIERIVILGSGSTFTQATIVAGTDVHNKEVQNVELAVQSTGSRLIIRKPDIRIGENFQIRFQ